MDRFQLLNLDLHITDDQISVSLGNGTSAKAKLLTSKYPDWRRVLPEASVRAGPAFVQVNPKYLERLGSSGAVYDDSESKHVRLHFCHESSEKPIEVTRKGIWEDTDWRGVVMPMKT
jgi:hypothetical protein